ncbi:MAG TPA: aldose epimerase family protein [Roseiarcus sp.]|nr:aldose epimerase family protein [Roseiarcus sp.]
MTKSGFGTVDGVAVDEIALRSNAGATAKIITWGAVVRDLVVPTTSGGPQRVVLGLNSLQDYIAHSPHFGAVPGRYANRIANGRFVLDGKEHALDKKPGDKDTLHGGPHGFGRRIWTLASYDEQSATLTLRSPDGEAGFPGALEARCVYRLIEPATLRVEFAATTDKPTVVNLTQHSYFNLDGSPDVLDHEVTLFADFYTPSDADLIPTGEIRSVAGTPYDFRRPRRVRNAGGTAYDTNFVVRPPLDPDGLAPVAHVFSPRNGLTLSLFSTAPGVQFYDAAKLSVPVEGLGGARYGAHAGLCLEPQAFPDSPNRRHFTDTVLRPGETYRAVSEFRFA